ncbi:hypothetical protein AtNW77_Chr2g0270871 [Arabidopsis thaliana]|uniref:Uncharacterized protein At2g47720 n=2 Tax=Arabidopsis thaliana TaxID=3702 RepID=O82241_ARATH|nr:uncharacterized protein AT2G47720 [Arabidopsis thaliana]AAC63628.1 hypothetical protein [Arabidopsis thaliana]AEC10881.1 hypothetical protein AT2G47720 [Arabidopsis thaliana]CAA0377555.1 unnamed protein product [Arabidopsis thaliana]VYS55848.1 unnamed protein product [Arabidopsis thaliana]|eukprot:NP_182294.1 hypothetical protein AT2G47720 [Arabidopsis thaliana]
MATVHVVGLKINSGSPGKDTSRKAPDAIHAALSPSSSLSLLRASTKASFDPVHGGEMSQLEYHNCLKPPSVF